VSDLDDDLELQALQRELDDAFVTTRPRRGYEDELWLRIRQRRPLWTRLGDSLAGLVQGARRAPALPAAAAAVVLVAAIGAGMFAYGGLGRNPSSSASLPQAGPAGANGAVSTGAGFGVLPAPKSAAPSHASQPEFALPDQGPQEYAGPVQLTWSGSLDASPGAVPVYRYQEPSTATADAFASGLGAALSGRPQGLLGSYTASTYLLSVVGTVAAPPMSPAYFILSSPAMPDVSAAGASPQDVATIFLAEHGLVPQWTYTVEVVQTTDFTIVRFVRQFTVGGRQAPLVDASGKGYGLEVDLRGNHPARVAGILPIDLFGATYPIVSAGIAVQRALATSTSGGPAVELTQGSLVYVLVPAGDYSFYEPAYLFSGSFKLNGSTYVKHVLVPALAQ
jgi:hypothetical protein